MVEIKHNNTDGHIQIGGNVTLNKTNGNTALN